MGKVVIEKFQCDRCHELFDKKPAHPTTHSLIATTHHEWAGGPVVEFKELCAPCNVSVGDLIDEIVMDAQALRTARNG